MLPFDSAEAIPVSAIHRLRAKLNPSEVSHNRRAATRAVKIQPRGLSARQAATYIGIGYSTLFELRKRDLTFPVAVRLSANRVAYMRDELDAWLDSKRVTSSNH
ncbi:AlpA family phage regulatory protein [Burkholderia sp. Ax-1719]|nr:AlpA family phage regulatory protein [Burkholderia sp. Ax-1719]